MVSDDDLRRVAEAFAQAKSERAAAKAMGLPRSTFKGRLKSAARRGFCGTRPVLPGFEVKQTSAKLDADGRLESEWVQQRPESGEVFAVPDGHNVRGVSALVDQDDRVRIKWVKTWQDRPGSADIVEAAKHAFADHKPARLIASPRQVARDLLTIYPIADQHHGLLSWKPQTGEHYDLKLGAARLRRTAADLISESPPSARAIILNLGDWQHNDDQRNVTPRSGHMLDVDGRYFKVLTTGIALMIDVIELAARRHHHVLVRNLPGNHDPHASVALTVALAAHYRRNPRITIDCDPSDFFFHRFGQTLFGACHGHKMRQDRMAMMMADVCRVDWGRTRYRHFFFGHIHHETAKAVGSVRVESFETLAGKDFHTASSGYTSGQSLQSITYHRTRGQRGRQYINIPPPVRRA